MARKQLSPTKRFLEIFAAFVVAFGIFIGAVTTSRADGDYHWLDTFSNYFDSTGDAVGAFDISPSGKLYVGGEFTHVGQNIEVNHVAMWDGANWHPLGLGVGANFGVLPSFVKIIAVSDTQVYFAGFFATLRNDPNANCGAATLTVNGIALWDGTCWHGFGPDADSYGVHGPTYAQVSDIEFFDGALWAVGLFQSAGETEAHGIAKWDGGQWQAVGGEPNYGMDGNSSGGALATDGTTLYIAGDFTSINGVTAQHVAKYSTAGGFSAVASGLENLAVYKMLVVGDTVYAGGYASDLSNNSLYASTNGGAWSVVGSGLNNGTSGGQIFALAYQNNELYVGGLFEATGDGQTIINLAKWNTQTLTWSEFGNPLSYPSGGVSHIKFFNGLTYVGGAFTQIGGKQSVHLAIYDPNATPPPPQANLNLDLATTESTVNSGDTFAFCTTVTNYGPDGATGITLTTSVPTGTTFDALSFDGCDSGGGGGESFYNKRVNGFASPLLAPNCQTPNVGQAGAIQCALDDLAQWDSQTIRVDVTVTAPPNSQIQLGASVDGNEVDSEQANNTANANVTVRPIIAYVSENADCASSTPCYQYLYEAFGAIADGGTVNVLAGTYNDSLYLYNNNTVNIVGTVTLNGELYLDSGTVNAGDGILTVNGNLTNDGAAFHADSGAVRFNGTSTQYVSGDFTFNNLIIANGATVELQNIMNIVGALDNQGTLIYPDQTQEVSANAPVNFVDGLNQPAVQMTAAGDLGSTTVTVTPGQTPSDCNGTPFPANVTPLLVHFEITPSTEGIPTTLRLYYGDGELNNVNEETIKIYHCGLNQTTGLYEWTLLSNSAANGDNNYAEATGVSDFSPFAMGGDQNAPTVATLIAAQAKLHKKGSVQVKWETGMELNVIGFNVYRSAKRDGAYKLVKPEIIAAKSPGEAIGNKYNLRDKHAKSGKTYFYKIEVVKASGNAEWSEPLKVKGK